MERPDPSVDLRKHPRARVQLPARIRWQGPLGMRVEVTQTLDLSREGVLVRRNEACEPGSRVWIAVPFESSNGGGTQPEIPARVMRVVRDEKNGNYYVAVRLERPSRPPARPADQERRRSERASFALPIFVRPAGSPWPEESMTHDVSQNGVRFETSHIYVAGDTVLAKIPWGDWSKAGEIAGRVVRVESLKDRPGPAPIANPEIGASAIFTSVAVEWTGPRAAAQKA